jgi:hypothetical protein
VAKDTKIKHKLAKYSGQSHRSRLSAGEIDCVSSPPSVICASILFLFSTSNRDESSLQMWV